MICPQCKCEYIRGVTQCADCGVPLVHELDSSAARAQQQQDDKEIISIWAGSDSGERSAVRGALEKAGIAVIDQEAPGHLFFPSNQPKAEIFVSPEDLERAKNVLADLGISEHPDEMTEEEREAMALPESDLPESDEAESLEEDSPADWDPQDWNEDDPGAEVWVGDNEDLADTLKLCLREIGIASRKTSEASRWRLAVRPEHESRAREIVREVEEASPPE